MQIDNRKILAMLIFVSTFHFFFTADRNAFRVWVTTAIVVSAINTKKDKEKIKCAALKVGENLIVSLPKPARHSDILKACSDNGIVVKNNCQQGFLTHKGKFVDRIEAAEITKVKLNNPPNLYSEDLW